MDESVNDVNQRIGQRVRELRATRRLSLEAVAAKSGVSRSMISLIERGAISPTAVVLDKLAFAFEVPLASLFDSPPEDDRRDAVVRADEQIRWQDPQSGYIRRHISPPGLHHPMQIVEVHFPPGQRIGFESGIRDHTVYEQIWICQGTMEITVGTDTYRLTVGDCLGIELGPPTHFYNPTQEMARYVVVTATERRQGQ
jgi:transcriptional regulator with XRE-family HTH domain